MAKRRKVSKPTIKKAHKIADAIKRSRRKGKSGNPYAIGMAVATGTAKRRKSRRKGRRKG
jgi:hypothetical protein